MYNVLLYATCRAIQLEACRRWVATSPGAIETWIDRTIGHDGAVPTGIGDRNLAAAL